MDELLQRVPALVSNFSRLISASKMAICDFDNSFRFLYQYAELCQMVQSIWYWPLCA